MANDRPELAEQFGRELVQKLVNDRYTEHLNSLRGQWAVEGANRHFRKLESLRLTPELRAFVWELIADAVENSYHAVVHLLDEKIALGEMIIELRSRENPDERLSFDGSVIDMPYGFSADMIEKYGLDAGALYEAAQSLTPLAKERPQEGDDKPDTEWLDNIARSEGRCTACGRPPDSLRRRCMQCGQAY
jgi:hypothetical protein